MIDLLHVVIVDDEKRIRTGLKRIIERTNGDEVKVHSFENGLKAFDFLVANQNTDVLITDIRMPVIDGIELLEKTHKMFPQLFKIIISGYEDFEYARQGIKFGVYDYLLKPVDKQELNRLLSKAKALKANDGDRKESDNLNEINQSTRIVELVKKKLDENYQKPLSLQDIADDIHLNPSYLSKLFKDTEGITITEYLIGVRMDKAKQFLEFYPEAKIYEVGEKVGYPDPVYFNKVFKRRIGVTPKTYKESIY